MDFSSGVDDGVELSGGESGIVWVWTARRLGSAGKLVHQKRKWWSRCQTELDAQSYTPSSLLDLNKAMLLCVEQ